MIDTQTFDFLNQLQAHNNKDWFEKNKPIFVQQQDKVKALFAEVMKWMQQTDFIDKFHLYRIYRDVRFSKDKTPYKNHFGGYFERTKPQYRGGYYLHIEPGNSFAAGGFWNPNPDDLLRIRQEFESDAHAIRGIIEAPLFKSTFGTLQGDGLKTAPKGFDKTHPNIDLIRKKQWIVTHPFTDKEVLSNEFPKKVAEVFKVLRPFHDYMSEVLTTNLNGESII